MNSILHMDVYFHVHVHNHVSTCVHVIHVSIGCVYSLVPAGQQRSDTGP